MYLQGSLQSVFDALYQMGIIDPVLEMDWQEALQNMPSKYPKLFEVVEVVNKNQPDVQKMILELERFDTETLKFLAMEVAREYADFHLRETLH
ncbi:MAG: cytochrome [Bdellovibrio sp.]|nr:MAG: cytochrome [Bdellovibrio sp.]